MRRNSVALRESGDIRPDGDHLTSGIHTHHMRKCLRDAERAAPHIGIAMIDADRPVADEDLAGADLGQRHLLETKPLEAAVLPEDNSFHHLR